jgi:heme A synthase
MPAPYNLTALQSATTITDLFTYANDVTNQMWFGFLMIAICIILIVTLKRYPFSSALLSSSFVCFILSAVLTYAGYLNFIFPLLFMIVAALTGLYMYMTDD